MDNNEKIEKVNLPEDWGVVDLPSAEGEPEFVSVSRTQWDALNTGYKCQSERIERLEAALRNLVEAVEQSAKDSLYLFQLGLQHGMSYRGRQYGEELEAAKAALEGK